MKLLYQHKTGLEPADAVIYLRPINAVATIPAIEALRAASASVERNSLPCGLVTITLGSRMPPNIIAVSTPDHDICLRTKQEPPYPQERPNFWLQADFLPCPVCSAPVVWYEAGYVPGYRVCTKKPHHHLRVAK